MQLARKLASAVTAAALALSLVPAAAFAQGDAQQETEARTWEQEAADTLGASYLQVGLAALCEAGRLSLPSGVNARVVESSDGRTGLELTGTSAQLAAAKITLPDAFEFTADKPVGRVSVDAVAGAGVSATVSVHVDGAVEPLASFDLARLPGEGQTWDRAGDKTRDVYGDARVAAGSHTVALGIRASRVDGAADAPVSVLVRTIEFSQSSLPVVYLDLTADEAAVSDEDRENGFGTVDDMNASDDHSMKCTGTFGLQTPAGYEYEYTGETAAAAENESLQLEYIRGRGNSTWAVDTDKKPYKLKFAKKQNLFGMGKSKHWVLLANALDDTLIKNRMALWLGSRLGLAYTPQCVPVDVVMNGTYLGSYLLAEQVRVEEERVNVGELDLDVFDDAEKTGGYLLSLSPYSTDPDEDKFTTTHGFELLNKSPATEDAGTEAQKANLQKYYDYIRDYVQKTEDAIYGMGFKDADGKGYDAFLDVDSFVKYWWVQEFTRNGDAFRTGSTYLYKARGGKLFWGPLWDFDLAWESDSIDFDGDLDSNVWQLLNNSRCPWVDQLKGDPRMQSKLTAFWFKTLSDVLGEMTADGGLLDSFYDETLVSWLYDKEKRRYENSGGPEAPEEWQEEDDRRLDFRSRVDSLKCGIDTRAGHIDDYIGGLGRTICAVDFTLDGETLETVYVPKGEALYYFPQPGARKGYIFAGWSKADGTLMDDAYENITRDMTLAALCVREKDAVYASNVYFDVKHFYRQSFDRELTLSYTTVPFNAHERSVTWTSSDESVATVDEDGRVMRTGDGDVTITATLKSGASNSVTITFAREGEDDFPEPETMAFPKKAVTLERGGYTQLVPDVNPKPTAHEYFEYQTSDEGVATVDERGVVHAVGAGTAKITATMYVGEEEFTTSCKVTVTELAKANPLKVTGKTTKVKAAKVKRGKVTVKRAKAFKVAKNASKAKITYKKTSGNAKIKVAKSGKVTVGKGLKRGTYRVKVTAKQKAGKGYKAKTVKGITVRVKVS